MNLRRFKDIIAIKTHDSVTLSDTIVAFHASNLEVAEISPESFNEMTPVDINDGQIPDLKPIIDYESNTALKEWNEEINPNAKSGKIEFGIRSITLNVNQICNLKCTYCAAGGDGTYGEAVNKISVEKTLPQLKYFLSSLKNNESFYISFVGGEPLLHPDAIKVIYNYVTEEARQKGITPVFKIVTNGTLFNDEVLKIIRTMNLDLTISIDGNVENNDSARPSKDGQSTTKKVLSGLEKLITNRGQIRSIHISAITTKSNNDLFNNFLFLNSLNADSIDFVFANDERDKASQQKYLSDYVKVMEYLWNIGGEKELRKLKLVDHYFKALDNQQKTENFCGAGKNYLMIDSKNRLYTCVWDANNKSESVGIGETLDKNELNKLSKPLIELNNCQTCWARYLCGGGCMYINKRHNGDKHKKSNLFCERTRSLILTTLLYYKQSRAADS